MLKPIKKKLKNSKPSSILLHPNCIKDNQDNQVKEECPKDLIPVNLCKEEWEEWEDKDHNKVLKNLKLMM